MQNIEVWIQEVQELVNRLSSAGQMGVCTFAQGEIEHCEDVDYDDSDWERVLGKSVPINGINTATGEAVQETDGLEAKDWNMTYGEAALRKRLTYPAFVEGIPTEHAKIFITMTILAPVRVYLDGKQIADFKYWGDTRKCELIISEDHREGKEYLLVLKTPKWDGDAHLGIYINSDILEKWMLKLCTAIEQVRFAQKLAKLYPDELTEGLMALNKKLDKNILSAGDWSGIESQLKLIDQILAPFDPYAKEFKVHMIAHAHIDMNWLWNYEDTVDICLRDFKTICDIMDENPDLRFSQSQCCVYEIVQKNDPATFARVLKKIQEGTWEVTASTWSENDLNLTGGEAMFRHLYTAWNYTRKVLKAPPSRVTWEPDTFGHPAAMPNILTKAGIKYYYHFRCPQGNGLTWWEGTDGSRVLDFAFGPYNNAIRPQNVMPVVHSLFDNYGLKSSMFVFGVGDHGGGPTKADIQIKRYLDRKPGLPSLIFSKACDFFDEALATRQDYPVVKGEQNTIFEGCYTTKTKIKKYTRHGESRMQDAEAVLAYRSFLGGQVEGGELLKAWRDLGFNGFHDIICGCGNSQQDACNYRLGESIINRANEVIGSMFAQQDTGTVIRVFNQLAFPRSEVVCLDAPHNIQETGILMTEDRTAVPYQIEDKKLYFIAHDLPPLSVTEYRISNQHKEEMTTQITKACSVKVLKIGRPKEGGIIRAETNRYQLELSALTGTIISLYDKEKQCDILEKMQPYGEDAGAFTAHKSSNLLKMTYEQPRIMNAWILGNEYATRNIIDIPEVTIVAEGPVFTRFKIVHPYGDSLFCQYITLYSNFDRIDFKADIDWHELGSDKTGIPTLKVGFTSDIQKPDFIYEIPYGSLIRNRQNSEFPAQRYVAVSEKSRTLALFNDCKYGFAASGSTLFMTLVRGSYSPSAVPDQGEISVAYSLKPYYGLVNKAQLTKDAASFNQPPIASLTTAGGREFQQAPSMGITSDNENVVVTCIKPAFEGKGLIVRVTECNNQLNKVTLQVPDAYANAYLTSSNEEIQSILPVQNRSVTFNLRPNEIKTLLLR